MGDRFQAGETELARRGVLGRSRGDRTSRSCEPTPIELLQRTAGNRRTAQLLGAPALLQRKLQIGGSTLTRESRHRERRPLMNDIDRIVKDKKYVTTVSAYGLVHQWIDDDTPHQFGSVDLLVNKLFEEEKLYKPARGGTLGPTKLGSRPDFSAEAKNMPAAGLARRHVISSSALGRAIEIAAEGGDPPAVYAAIDGFLRRNKAKPLSDFLPGKLYPAARAAWELVHSHIGNLWPGPSVPNSVRGFIRGTFRAEGAELRGLRPDLPILVADVMERVDDPRGPGMQRKGASELWSALTGDFHRVLLWHSAQYAEKHPDQDAGWVEAGIAAAVVEEFEQNADLDLPQTSTGELAVHGDYLTAVIEVYHELIRNPTPEIFAPNGALDRFMRLRCR